MSNSPKSDYLNADQIVFEGRNKAYGANELRNQYERRMLKAFGITTGSLVVIMGLALLWGAKPVDAVEDDIQVCVLPITLPAEKLNIPAPPKRPETQAGGSEKATTKQLTDKITLKDNQPKELPDQRSLDSAQTGSADYLGNGDPNALPGEGAGKGAPTGGGTGFTPPAETENLEAFLFVEQMPEFPNGEKGMMTFIQQNVKYPQEAIKQDVEGTVFVEFVVGQDGALSDIKVVRGQPAGLDQAAIDVVRKMPKWIPGRNNGKSVKVKVTVPIKFRLG